MVELIFLHLPKTGGSSILASLEQAYGLEHVRHFERDECIELSANKLKISDVIGPQIKAIHGHIRYKEVKDIVKRDSPKLVTFMRKPVTRVISNFNWWKKSMSLQDKHPAIHRRDESLSTYIEQSETRNKMSYFLKGSKLEHFYFIGFLEQFEIDIKVLERELGWPEITISHKKNSQEFNAQKEKTPSNELKERILRLNKKDMQLYIRAKELWAK